MNNFIQPGEVLPLTTPGGGVVKGTPVKVGSLLVVPTVTITAAQVVADATIQFSALITGVVEVTRTTGGGTAWTEGVAIYWDQSAGKFTKSVISDTGDCLVGVAVAAAGDSATTGKVRLDGVVR